MIQKIQTTHPLLQDCPTAENFSPHSAFSAFIGAIIRQAETLSDRQQMALYQYTPTWLDRGEIFYNSITYVGLSSTRTLVLEGCTYENLDDESDRPVNVKSRYLISIRLDGTVTHSRVYGD